MLKLPLKEQGLKGGSKLSLGLILGGVLLLWQSFAMADQAVEVQSQPPLSSVLATHFMDSDKTSLILQNKQGQILYQKQPNLMQIPASTTKLLTAYLALDYWGAGYRFQTDFFVKGHQLIIQGYGDPFLTSEEITKMAIGLAQKLKAQHIQHLDQVLLDTHYYQAGVVLPGRDDSTNPYDAVPSALTANFNTVNVKVEQGHYVSAEPQTPLTEVAVQVVKKMPSPLTRVNVGADSRVGERNFVEILAYFLKQQGILLTPKVSWLKQAYPEQPVFYRYKNSHAVVNVIKPMMKYSTNFIANQLALNLSAALYGPPATAQKVKRLYQQAIKKLGWQQAYIEDGAGLSHRNRLSARQLMDLLVRFKPWGLKLLPQILPDIYAKSGSLIGVSTLAGIIQANHKIYPFVVMMNEKMPYHYRNKVAKALQSALND